MVFSASTGLFPIDRKMKTFSVTKRSSLVHHISDLEWVRGLNEGLTSEDLILLLDAGADCEAVLDPPKFDSGRVVSYILYETTKDNLLIHSLGTHEDYERRGIASSLIAVVTAKLKSHHSGVWCKVPLRAIEYSRVLTKNGFRLMQKKDHDNTHYTFFLENPSFIPPRSEVVK